MEAKIFRSKDIRELDLETVKVKEILTEKDSPSMSMAIVKVNGENETSVNTECDMAYFVMEGKGDFTLHEEGILNVYPVESGDLVFIPKGITYSDSGEMTLMACSTPAFNRDQQQQVK